VAIASARVHLLPSRSDRSRLRLPDALVLATALHLKADRVLTTDTGWRTPV
jgi:predicted nucleic acid-binding protein